MAQKHGKLQRMRICFSGKKKKKIKAVSEFKTEYYEKNFDSQDFTFKTYQCPQQREKNVNTDATKKQNNITASLCNNKCNYQATYYAFFCVHCLLQVNPSIVAGFCELMIQLRAIESPLVVTSRSIMNCLYYKASLR